MRTSGAEVDAASADDDGERSRGPSAACCEKAHPSANTARSSRQCFIPEVDGTPTSCALSPLQPPPDQRGSAYRPYSWREAIYTDIATCHHRLNG